MQYQLQVYPAMTTKKIDPYHPCPCGSGRKYKFCCYASAALIGQQHPRALVHQAASYPVTQCWFNANWQQHGMATVYVFRQLPNAKFISGVYLVDTLCLGVKGTLCNANISNNLVQRMLAESGMPLDPIDYEDARSLILGGVAFARNLGFEPDPDWVDSKYVIEADKPFQAKYEYGQNGQPFYVQGPDDDALAIMERLAKR